LWPSSAWPRGSAPAPPQSTGSASTGTSPSLSLIPPRPISGTRSSASPSPPTVPQMPPRHPIQSEGKLSAAGPPTSGGIPRRCERRPAGDIPAMAASGGTEARTTLRWRQMCDRWVESTGSRT
jgi:hypothetical protein